MLSVLSTAHFTAGSPIEVVKAKAHRISAHSFVQDLTRRALFNHATRIFFITFGSNPSVVAPAHVFFFAVSVSTAHIRVVAWDTEAFWLNVHVAFITFPVLLTRTDVSVFTITVSTADAGVATVDSVTRRVHRRVAFQTTPVLITFTRSVVGRTGETHYAITVSTAAEFVIKGVYSEALGVSDTTVMLDVRLGAVAETRVDTRSTILARIITDGNFALNTLPAQVTDTR